MSYQDWLPASWAKHKHDDEGPFGAFRKQVDDLFDDFGNGFFAGRDALTVRSNVSETDKEICITAELPGLTDKDVDVAVAGNQITIKGEKESELDEKGEEEGREFHRVERTSGAFRRMMTLPFEIDPDAVNADVKDGVLTVTIPKPVEMVEKTKKIKVTHSQ